MSANNVFRAVIGIKYESSHADDVISYIKSLDYVEKAYEITGKFDVTAIISAPNILEMNKRVDQIRKYRGVTDTETNIVLNSLKG